MILRKYVYNITFLFLLQVSGTENSSEAISTKKLRNYIYKLCTNIVKLLQNMKEFVIHMQFHFQQRNLIECLHFLELLFIKIPTSIELHIFILLFNASVYCTFQFTLNLRSIYVYLNNNLFDIFINIINMPMRW